MKTLLLTLITIAFVSCSKEKAPVAKPSLVGTRWSTFNYKSFIDGTNVYQILRFKNATEVEVYSATEKTKVIGDIEVRAYVYEAPTLTISSKTFTGSGEVSDNLIRIYSKDFTKEN